MKRTYFYGIEDYGEGCMFPIETTWPIGDCLAEKCADDYHSNHDGWESSWPLTIAIRETEDGPTIARFSVDRETVPQFTAKQLALPVVS